ncbi:MAG TPA: ABC transporter ATP-binding protein [Puia sp.]|jgi:ABC-2 type transport system ATP-binding protein|nr:ABC transporter ATP-binding protein [Puia sp.]
MIAVNNLIKAYNGNVVVNIPQLATRQGEIIGLVGNNGAGKTTFFRLILDLVRADRGEIVSGDKNVASSEDWKNYTAAYLDEGFLINYLTPEEYFYFVGSLNNRSRTYVDDFLRNFDAFFDGSVLRSGKYIRDLSKGNQFKVGIAACLLREPQVLILDEPFANLDPSSQLRLIKMLKEWQERNPMTIFVSSHDINHITDVCSRILLMEKGRIIKDFDTTAETLQELETYFKV